MRTLLILCLAAVLTGCGRQKTQKQYDELVAKDIVVPSGMRQLVGGRDSIVLNPAAGAAKLVVWVDSTDCSPCRVGQLFQYYKVINYREEKGEEFAPIFIFSPSRDNLGDVMEALKNSEFDFPVFVDENYSFKKANSHIPADNKFHAFLLDKNGKVGLVGDPTRYPDLWELYKTTIATLIENGGTMPDVNAE